MSTSSDLSQNSGLKVADPPFNDKEADVIIRTSDDVLFYMSKSLLSFASPHFANMFTLPPTTAASTLPSDHIDGTPVVSVTEHSGTMSHFLSFCHPAVPIPSLETPFEVLELYTAGDKYLVDSVKVFARKELGRLIEDQPVGAYLVAFHMGWKQEATGAAQESLKIPPGDITRMGGKEFLVVPVVALHWLSKYRNDCAKELDTIFNPTYLIGHQWDDDYMASLDPEASYPGVFNHLHPSPITMRETEVNCLCYQTYSTYDDREIWSTHWNDEFVQFEQMPRSLKVLCWFETYLKDLRKAMAESLMRPDIDSAIWMKQAISESQACPKCSPIAIDILQHHANYTKRRMSHCIKRVSLEGFGSSEPQ